MIKPLVVLAFTVGLLTPYAASAQINTPAPTANPGAPAPAVASVPADKVASNSDNVVICRYEVEAGTRFTQRICHTQRQWKQKERDAYDLLDKLDSGKDQAVFQ